MPLLVLASEPVASRRRVYFQLVAADGVTPALSEAGGQPQVSSDGAAWTATGVGTLVAVGSGRYYADLTALLVATPGARIETRYKSSATAECPGDTVAVVTADPYALPVLGPAGLDNVAVESGVNARQMLALIGAEACGTLAVDTAGVYTFSAVAHPGVARVVAATGAAGRTSVTATPPA